MSTHVNQVVLVSGCSAGFGFRSARALAQAGHTVIAGMRARSIHGQRYAAELTGLRRAGLDVTLVPLDVDNEDSVRDAVAAALKIADGRLDALVNTAAYSVLGPVEACGPEQLATLLDTNVVGSLRLLRAVLPTMRAAGRGRIVQLTSGLGRAVLPFMGIYAASAWAQEAMIESLAYEVAGFGVEVAILAPAGYRTSDRPRKAVGDRDRLAAYQEPLIAFGNRVNSTPPGDEDPEEVAEAVVATVEAEQVQLRTPVGAAARRLVALRDTLTAEQYEQEILQRAGLHAVYERDEHDPD